LIRVRGQCQLALENLLKFNPLFGLRVELIQGLKHRCTFGLVFQSLSVRVDRSEVILEQNALVLTDSDEELEPLVFIEHKVDKTLEKFNKRDVFLHNFIEVHKSAHDGLVGLVDHQRFAISLDCTFKVLHETEDLSELNQGVLSLSRV